MGRSKKKPVEEGDAEELRDYGQEQEEGEENG